MSDSDSGGQPTQFGYWQNSGDTSEWVDTTPSQGITAANLSSAYQNMFGREAPQDWIQQTQQAYSDPNNTMSHVMANAAAGAAADTVPFQNAPGAQTGFTSGADYYTKQGYIPSGQTYEGVPTQFIDPKTGQVVASYGILQEAGGNPRSTASNAWRWNQAATTPKGYETSLAMPKTDWNNAFQQGLTGAAFALSPVAAGMGLSALGVGAGAEALPVAMGDSITMAPLGEAAGIESMGGIGAGEAFGAEGYGALGTQGGVGSLGTGAAGTAAATEAAKEGFLKTLQEKGLGAAISTWAGNQSLTDWLKYGLGAAGIAGLGKALSGSSGGGSSGGGGGAGQQPGQIRPYTFSQVKNPNYTGAGTPYFLQSYQAGKPYAVGMAGGGIAGLGTQGNMYPMSQMDHTQYATPTQMPTSAEVINAGYEEKTNPYAGEEPRFASGGISHLGDYSDGGRLLKGPGDGVSDDIPAQIGDKQPARLADGEFVVPARIVSELGNGSTDAGAKRLYAMMDRIQAGRKKSIGKDKVAVDSKAEKHLPA